MQQAKSYGDVLIVLVNSDSSVQANKGKSRPIVPLAERMEMLASLDCVDYVFPFDEPEVMDCLKKIRPNVHVKGGTYIPERVESEKNLVEQFGGKHICLGKIGDYSSTNIIEKIRHL